MDKININEIKLNKNNPRFIRDEKFTKLINSIKDFPEMLKIRPIIIDENNIILWWNMRYQALKSLWKKEVYVKQVKWLSDKQKKEFVVKDNIGYWQWDIDLLSNDFDLEELEDWGLDLDFKEGEEIEKTEWEMIFTKELIEENNYIVLVFNNEVDWLNLLSNFELESVDWIQSNKQIRRKGIWRVIDGVYFLSKIEKWK